MDSLIGQVDVVKDLVGDGERASAVFVDQRAHVGVGRGDLLDGVAASTHHRSPAALIGSGLRPPEIVTVDTQLTDTHRSAHQRRGGDR